jgi:hypothetical protein
MQAIATIMPSTASVVVNFARERKGKYMVRTLRTLALPGNSHYARFSDETLSLNLVADAVDYSGNDGLAPNVRRKDSRAIREIGPGMC